MRLGTAASRSTREVIGRRSPRGAYSVMNRAAPIDSGTAMTRAMIAISTVPSSTAEMPNRPLSGVQLCSVRKLHPAARSAGRARARRNAPISAISASVADAARRATSR